MIAFSIDNFDTLQYLTLIADNGGYNLWMQVYYLASFLSFHHTLVYEH